MTVTVLPARQFTRADLDAMPDDGHRYELIDGALVVTPSPTYQHQRVLRGLFVRLHERCPIEFEILFAPSTWRWLTTL